MASADILSRLGTRLNGATRNRNTPDIATRSIGGSFRDNHPYISGNFQVMFELPDVLFANTDKSLASKWLHSSCESFTLPSVTINTVEVPGLGQVKSRFYASRTVSNDFTVAFREYQNLPVSNVIRSWGSVMDPFVGVSSLRGNQFIPSSYKGTCYVLQLKPTGAFPNRHISEEDVEEAYIFDGCFPTGIPMDAFTLDINSADVLQLSITFSYDGHPFTSSEGAVERCLEIYTSLGHNSYMDTQSKWEASPLVNISGESRIGG